ncbi:hypothetical protein LNP47_08665 [Klebsiella pneumoniae subsp. pneumoniae]|nr:hypothetical protein [Klebsiella pneumoniae subsp. pneumoniae]
MRTAISRWITRCWGEYDEQLAHYYLSRGSNARRDTWSDHIRRTIVKESRPFILDYLHKQGVGNALITCTLLLRPGDIRRRPQER